MILLFIRLRVSRRGVRFCSQSVSRSPRHARIRSDPIYSISSSLAHLVLLAYPNSSSSLTPTIPYLPLLPFLQPSLPVCAVAARYWVERPEMYTTLMHHARAAAATAITDGWKSLEVCQAYLLLSVYPQPARSWEEDRAWLFLGCAIRCVQGAMMNWWGGGADEVGAGIGWPWI